MEIRKTIGVRLTDAELTALKALANREDRDARRQAARLVREGLIRVGLLAETGEQEDGTETSP
jgi:uncharacterized protein with FMN-binding domain